MKVIMALCGHCKRRVNMVVTLIGEFWILVKCPKCGFSWRFDKEQSQKHVREHE